YARTGVALAAGQDDRELLIEVGTSGSEALERAAEAALAGTDAEVVAFLNDPAYPERDLEDRITVAQILAEANDTGGVTVAREAQRSLDGTPAARRAFITEGQYVAQRVDDRIRVARILADPDTGPETKAAAQVALDAPAGVLRHFLEVDRHAAAQRDADAAAHESVVSALLDQAEQAAYNATNNALIAQQAAAVARGAAADAARFAAEAQTAAQQAAAAATRAQQSATAAQASATAAAASAETARQAAVRANRAQKQASHSAMWATVSQNQAARHANTAFDAYKNAYDSAIAAGRSRDEAVQLATDARTDALDKIQRERIQRWMIEERICANQLNQLAVDYETCMKRAGAVLKGDPKELAKIALINGEFCGLYAKPGSDVYKSCLADVFSPTFEINRIVDMVTPALVLMQYLLTVSAIGMGIALTVTLAPMVAGLCGAVCAGALEALGPILSPELIGVPIAGYAPWIGNAAGTFASIRIASLMEKIAVQAKVDEAALARLAQILRGTCLNSFTPDTPVLMADGSRRAIADVRVGDLVLATDPETDTTAARPVTDTIGSSGEKRLVDITVGNDVVTATAGHPFWVADLRRWVDAEDLRAGQMLRTSAGTWVQVSAVAARTAHASAHNLTVADLHTFYVFAGDTPVLAHNANCLELTDLGGGAYLTPAGLIYGPGSVHGHRIFHVLAHGSPDPSKPLHTVFHLRPGESILGMLDEAWVARDGTMLVGITDDGARAAWMIRMDRPIGTAGETHICLIIANLDEVITAFPIAVANASRCVP
ncbi:MAG TPA: polymorphic toxin-type HINT domain-containing protein, partial [Micromonosporaceae bacterium]|nr:polymorphic toxin-type HINT domain-containing protein [Micromonosporaceae bacterium]